MGQYRILILDGSPNSYNGGTIDLKPAGGISLITTRLAEQLASRGCDITVRNATEDEIFFSGVRWENIKRPYKGPRPDIILTNNDSNLLNDYAAQIADGAVPALWLRNLFTWKRLIKKKRIGSLFRWRPAAVFLSAYQEKACSDLMPFRSRQIIPHAVGESFFDYPTGTGGRKPQAVFLSKPFRRFDFVARVWVEQIHPACPEAVLKAYVSPDEVADLDIGYTQEEYRAANIVIAGRAPQSAIMEDLAISACHLCPGHKDETFCNVAAEATVLGLPTVTLGKGSLRERVAGGGGIVVKDDRSFAAATLKLLQDDSQRQAYSRKALDIRDQYRWDRRMDLWFDFFARVRGTEYKGR